MSTTSSGARHVKAAGIGAALVLLAGCAEAHPGVGLKDVSADVAFTTVKASPLAAAPPANSVLPTGPLVPAAGPGTTPFEPEPRFPDPDPQAELCPKAAAGSYPTGTAPDSVRGLPRPGDYRWTRAGRQTLSVAPGTPAVTLKVAGLERRTVENVQPLSATRFRYDVRQVDLATQDTVVTTYLVRTDATAVRAPTADVRAGEPDRGLSIERVVRYDARTKKQKGAAFAPVPAVLVLPLPVLPGERFQSAGVDPGSLTTMNVTGVVGARELVDACGSLVYGWGVDLTEAFGSNAPVTHHLVVATQLGAIPVRERVQAADAQRSVDVTFTIGQLAPTTRRHR